MAGNLGVVTIALYVLVMLAIGLWAMKRTKSVGDFFLGGRSIGPWMSAFAYGTTYFSAVLFIGYGGKLGWGFGLHTMWIVAGNVLIGSLLAWWVLGRRTREMTARLGAMTMPAFLAERYKSPALKVAAAVLIFVFLVPYSASVYMGLTYLFEKGFGISEMNALVLLAALTGVYLVLGGYFAVTITDFIMGLMMVLGVTAMLTYLTGDVGGIAGVVKDMVGRPWCAPGLQPPPPGVPAPPIPGWLTLASLVIITSFGPWGLPQMVQKFYSIRSGSQVKRAMIVASVFALLMTFGGYFTGAMTHLHMPDHGKSKSAISVDRSAFLSPKDLPAVAGPDGETVVGPDGKPVIDWNKAGYTSPKELPVKMGPDGEPKMLPNGKPDLDWDRWMPQFLAQKLPPWVLTLILLLVLSASMSTLSSLVLVSSSAIAMDLYAGVLKPAVEKTSVLLLMRVLCAVFVFASLAIAISKPSYIIVLMVISWGVLAGAFGAPYLYGLFWRRTTPAGAGAGMFFGVALGVTLFALLGEPGIPLAGAIAILAPFIVVPVVSLFTKPLPKEIVANAFTDSP